MRVTRGQQRAERVVLDRVTGKVVDDEAKGEGWIRQIRKSGRVDEESQGHEDEQQQSVKNARIPMRLGSLSQHQIWQHVGKQHKH